MFFMNFPLTQIHLFAEGAAEASLAAAAQGKFWQMYDALYESEGDALKGATPKYPENLKIDKIEQTAAKIPGLDIARFNQELNSHK